MEQKFKIIPFNLERAKTPENPNGLEVVTRVGNDVKIIYSDYKGSLNTPIIGLVQNYRGSYYERCFTFYANGHYKLNENDEDDLFLKEPITPHRMTNKELSWWLQEHPEEHRETMFKEGDWISSIFNYNIKNADEEVSSCILIRSNGGSWREPLIGIEEEK